MPEAPALLVGVWGYPWAWKPAEYTASYREKSVELTSKTSLEPLVELLEPVKVLVAAADTIVGREGVERATSYKAVVEAAVARLYEWVSSEAPRLKSILDEGRGSFLILPNVGVYAGCEWRFAHGLDPFDTVKSMLFLRLYEELVDATLEKPRAVLALDLTHGINYMPTALYEAALDAARLASLTTGASIEVLVFNSEPYPQGASGTPRLEIHLLSSMVFHPGSSAVEVAERLPIDAIRGGNVAIRVVNASGKEAAFLGPLNTDAREVVAVGVRVSTVILYSLPLAAAYAAVAAGVDVSDASSIASDALDAFHAYTVVDGKACRVLHKAGLDYRGLRAVYASAALARHVKRAYLRALGDQAPCTLEELEDRGVYLDELTEIAARLNPVFSEFAVAEIERSLRKLTECKCSDSGTPQCPSDKPPVPVYCQDWPGEAYDKGRANPRNFLAHGGLAWETIEASIDQSGVAVRYREGGWSDVWERLLYEPAKKIARLG